MRFSTTAQTNEIPLAIIIACSLIGARKWERRAEIIADQIKQNSMLREFYFDRYEREIAFLDVWPHFFFSIPPIWPPQSRGVLNFYSFCTMFSSLHHHLIARGQKRLLGMARDGLKKSEYGLSPLASEFTTISHLMAHGSETCPTYSKVFIVQRFSFICQPNGRAGYQRDIHARSRLHVPQPRPSGQPRHAATILVSQT